MSELDDIKKALLDAARNGVEDDPVRRVAKKIIAIEKQNFYGGRVAGYKKQIKEIIQQSSKEIDEL